MTRPVNVFFSIDQNYVQHFTVAVTSLLENNKDLDFRIFVINNIVDKSKLDVPFHYIKSTYNVELKFIDISHVDFSRFTTNQHYTSATYYRLFLAEILPINIVDGLILDSDLIVTGSIKDLVNIDIKDSFIYAADEAFVAHNVERFEKIGISLNSYFNAGVLLVNLKKWRTEGLTFKFLQVADKYMKQLEWYDQDILNIFFKDFRKEFDKKYNAVHLTKQLSEMPVIVHYASVSKPWFYVDTHPYNYLYWKYLKLTPFRKNRAVGFSIQNAILKNGRLVKRKLRKLGIIKSVF